MESQKLPDNSVEYNVYQLESQGVTSKSFTELRPKLDTFCNEVYSLFSKELVDYIWHAEPFHLSPLKKPFPHAGGRTVFGENIEDEWFIVYLMFELTKRCQNTAISIYDNDGQFLLIEAADYLPAWLGPENSENRVWIYRGQVHIVPEIIGGRKVGNVTSVDDALGWIAKDPAATVAAEQIQEQICKRIYGYPEKIMQLQHRLHCYVPAAIAVLGKLKPSLLSAAIQAFYLRDPIDLRACKAMKHFPPETRVLSDFVISKLQYAQLLQQNYHPDKRTGWDMPTTDDPHYKALDLGVKIASGFEIICAYGERVKSIPDDVLMKNVETDKDWLEFFENLQKSGYFQKLKPGSDELRHRVHKGQDFFIESRKTDEAHIPRERYGAIILRLLRTTDVDIDGLKRKSHTLSPADDDSWLTLTADEVDTLLQQRSSNAPANSNGSGSQFDPSQISESIKRFMESVSGLEGAEFPDEMHDAHSMDTSKMDHAISKILELNIYEGEDDDGRNSSAMTDYSDEEDHPFELPKGTKNELENLQAYLHQMDRELAKTAVGKSFERENYVENGKSAVKNGAYKKKPENGGSAPRNGSNGYDSEGSIDEEDDDYRPVDVNVNLVKNILASCSSEQGVPGPATSMLKRMGVNLPPDKDNEK